MAGDWASGQGRQGEEHICGRHRQVERGREPQNVEPLGLTEIWAQVEGGKMEGIQTRDGSHRIAQGSTCG